MKTNSKSVRAAIRAHILESVTDYNGDPLPTFDQAREHLRAEFARAANDPHNLRRLPNHQERFHDYLMGIPFGFEVENHAIATFLEGLGIGSPERTYSPEKSARVYTYLIFREIQ